MDTYLSNPIVMASERANTITSGNLPNLYSPVARTRDDMIARWCELNGRHIVIVSLQCLHASVGLVEVPQSDGHVGRARGEHASTRIKRHVLYDVRVTLETTLEVARFVVPDFYGHVFGARRQYGVDWMKYDPGHCRSMT